MSYFVRGILVFSCSALPVKDIYECRLALGQFTLLQMKISCDLWYNMEKKDYLCNIITKTTIMRTFFFSLMLLPAFAMSQTLEECQRAAERNYPLIKQYGLIEKTTKLTVENIQKGWLPQVSASAQATLQSDVTAFPDEFQKLYQQVGLSMEGLKKDQYRVGIDVQQTVYDGALPWS